MLCFVSTFAHQENLDVWHPSVTTPLRHKKNYKKLKEIMTNWCSRWIALFLFVGISLSYANAKKPKSYVVENGIRYAIYKDHAEVAPAPQDEKYGGHIVIPATIMDGLMPVTAVGEDAFIYSDIDSIELQEGIVSIESYAFYCCKQLEYVQLPQSIRKIGDWAFDDCISLEHIVLPVGLEEIGDFAFAGCTALRSLYIPETVKKIKDGAFYECILDPLVIATTQVKASSYHIHWSANNWSVMYVNDYAMKIANFWSKTKNISEYRENTDSIDVEATIDQAINVSWDSLETKEKLCIDVIKADRKNKKGMQRVAYLILGQIYQWRYEQDDRYYYYSDAKSCYETSIALEEGEDFGGIASECLARLEEYRNEREQIAAEQYNSEKEEDSFLSIATQMIGVIGALSGKGTSNSGSYSSGGTVSTGSGSSSSKASKQTITCSLCKGSGRSAAREYAFQAASKPKVWCAICGSKELQHVHNKVCTRCSGKGYITK